MLPRDQEFQPVLKNKVVRDLINRAMADIEAKTNGLDVIIHFSESEWELDQDLGTLTFVRTDGMRATANVQVIGTYNTADGSWLWAWDHPSIDKTLAQDSRVVKQFGEERRLKPLTTRKINCQESDCWEFTALACMLCDRQGAYRGPSGDTRVFMTFGSVTLSSNE